MRECARIQTFPDNFKFLYTDIKDGYKMVGNAVPPRLAWYLAIQMKKAFANDMPMNNGKLDVPKSEIIKKTPVSKIIEQYSPTIIDNKKINPIDDKIELSEENITYEIDKHVLIGLVKSDNIDLFINNTSVIFSGSCEPSV